MQPYKFCDTATETKPDTATTRLLEKVLGGSVLSRTEADNVAEILYGIFSPHSNTYRLLGWAWPMACCLPRILVGFGYEPGVFRTYYAPDKTSLRKAITDRHRILEMIYA